MRILNESVIQDVESYLRSFELLKDVNQAFPDKNNKGEAISDYVQSRCEELFDEVITPVKVRALVIKSNSNEDFEVVTGDHYVLEYNGMFYDFAASQFKDIFPITNQSLPVIQPILTSDKLIKSTVSSVKGYVLLRYSENIL